MHVINIYISVHQARWSARPGFRNLYFFTNLATAKKKINYDYKNAWKHLYNVPNDIASTSCKTCFVYHQIILHLIIVKLKIFTQFLISAGVTGGWAPAGFAKKCVVFFHKSWKKNSTFMNMYANNKLTSANIYTRHLLKEICVHQKKNSCLDFLQIKYFSIFFISSSRYNEQI